jgi:hypothetical protein
MKEIPILFSTPMIQAIQEDRKGMTRRIRGLDEINKNPDEWILQSITIDEPGCLMAWFENKETYEIVKVKCPYGKPKTVLWVRETWGNYSYDVPESNAVYFMYRADYPENAKGYWYEPEQINWCDFPRWRPSIHMPREACRIRLKITDIRVERLQDITADDAIAEGIELSCRHEGYICSAYPCDFKNTVACKDHFKDLWDSLHKKDGHGWDHNDWVFVVSFDKVSL